MQFFVHAGGILKFGSGTDVWGGDTQVWLGYGCLAGNLNIDPIAKPKFEKKRVVE